MSQEQNEIATFAAGCFWSVEAKFDMLDGVVDTKVGYTGGQTENPTYKDVCTGTTGHTEAVQVTYDPAQISYEQLLDAFWEMHNPTQKDGQGLNIGTNYRSTIFFHTPEQEQIATASKEDLNKSGKHHGREAVTEIVSATTFWDAEEVHQGYMKKHGGMMC